MNFFLPPKETKKLELQFRREKARNVHSQYFWRKYSTLKSKFEFHKNKKSKFKGQSDRYASYQKGAPFPQLNEKN